jgi:hypothetical protein
MSLLFFYFVINYSILIFYMCFYIYLFDSFKRVTNKNFNC